jgi:hypothetical protein
MTKKRKKVDSEEVQADGVGSAEVRAEPVRSAEAEGSEESAGVVILAERALRAVVMLVADKQGKTGVVLVDWVEAVLSKINAVGITTLRELVEGILTLNERLGRARRPKFHNRTVQALLMEAVDLVYWPESDVGGLEVGSEEAEVE